MKKVAIYLLILVFMFGISSVSAIKVNIYGYKCLTANCGSSTNVLTKQCSSDTCAVSGFTASNYCNAAGLGKIFRYRISATNTVAQNLYNIIGSNTDKSKGNIAFTCGGCYIDKDGDKWGVGPIVYQDVSCGCPTGTVISTAYKGKDACDNNPAYTSTGPGCYIDKDGDKWGVGPIVYQHNSCGCPTGTVIWTVYKGKDVYDNNPIYTSTGPIWVDMNGNIISSSSAGNMVELKGRETSKYKIYNSNGQVNVATLTSDAKGVAYWKLPESPAVYYFTTNTTGSLKSSLLTVGSATIKHSPMIVKLVSPNCGSHFNVGSNINIAIDVNDSDDLVNGTIKIDGEVANRFHNGKIHFNKLMNKSGDFKIVVDSNNNHGDSSREISNIMVLDKKNGKYVDKKYAAACIKEPKDSANIPGSMVNFDASTTRGINVVNGVLHELIPGKDKLSWYWIFMPGNVVRNYINTTQQIAYKFTAEFPIAGHNSATLRVGV